MMKMIKKPITIILTIALFVVTALAQPAYHILKQTIKSVCQASADESVKQRR